jgi:orotidine-5'-phosphate decarboxylase
MRANEGARPTLITALDVSTPAEALGLVEALRGTVDFFKIGSRLFTAAGPGMVEDIKRRGARIFLDCKFHDIPATVAGAVREATKLGIDMMTLHTLGGIDMMRAAATAAAEEAERSNVRRPLVVGVTVLTSMSRSDVEAVFGRTAEVAGLVLALAGRAREAGLDGVVASVGETARIKRETDPACLVVTPGIRPTGTATGDQKRVATPREAAEAGSDFIVVGRPIIQASSPVAAARGILEELQNG